MKTAQRNKDRRQGYMALEGHYLGPNNVANMATWRQDYVALESHYLGLNNVVNMAISAECKLKNTAFPGEKRHWTFENFVHVHVDQHAILASLVDLGYSDIDERSKVRHLMDGIRAKEFLSVKAYNHGKRRTSQPLPRVCAAIQRFPR